eukprot:1158671-Pelagomonas_calceolata.AAC.9
MDVQETFAGVDAPVCTHQTMLLGLIKRFPPSPFPLGSIRGIYCHSLQAYAPPHCYTLVHLLPRTASLQQAGGLHRMTLRSHTMPIKKVRHFLCYISKCAAYDE